MPATPAKRRFVQLALAGASLLAIGYVGLVLLQVYRWNTQHWFFTEATESARRTLSPTPTPQHLIFVLVDHFEPGKHPKGNTYLKDAEQLARAEDWLTKYEPIARKHSDSTGKRVRYTWFYPFDENVESIVARLNRAVYEGYGELELHWHHPTFTNAEYPARLQEAVSWFQRYGALLSCGDEPRSEFAFIHGNWTLDDANPNLGDFRCGVTQELSGLYAQGCYADFTFSTILTPAQPTLVNRIFYANDTLGPKSHDTGTVASVGQPVDGQLMIFEGPMSFNWSALEFEYGALEPYARPSRERIRRWIDANVHVQGRPEWLFVKVYSHGIAAQKQILEAGLDQMFTDLEQEAADRGMSLHYMSAREAYNVVKAAELGREGNPSDYRDLVVPRPCNQQLLLISPSRVIREGDGFAAIPLAQDAPTPDYPTPNAPPLAARK